MENLSSSVRRRPLQVAIAGVLAEVGFDCAERMPHETLIEITQSCKWRISRYYAVFMVHIKFSCDKGAFNIRRGTILSLF